MDKNDPRAALLPQLADLRAYARFLSPQRTEADDLVQETLVRALASLPQFRTDSNMRAWLFVILRNVFYEQARRRRNERTALEHALPVDVVRVPAQEARGDLADLQTQLFALPPHLREALVLVGAHGMSYEEAAGICRVPVGTMKARVSRARLRLARLLHRAVPAPAVGEVG